MDLAARCRRIRRTSNHRPGRPRRARLSTPLVKTFRQQLDACRRCELWRNATQAVAGAGNAKDGIMLVGEQPGDQEDREGRPFVGPAGRVLDECLAAAGLERKGVYVTNAVKHFKWEPRGKRRLHKRPSSSE